MILILSSKVSNFREAGPHPGLAQGSKSFILIFCPIFMFECSTSKILEMLYVFEGKLQEMLM